MTKSSASQKDRDAHFETICAYLASPLKTEAGIGALIDEAEAIIRSAPPSEDMIFAAFIVSETPALADLIHEIHGLLGFDACDPFNTNLRTGWATSGLSDPDLARLFGYMLDAHLELFAEDPADTLAYAVSTRSPGAIAHVVNKISPAAADVTRAMTQHRGLHALTRETAAECEPLMKSSLAAPENWDVFVRNCVSSTDTRGLALAAKIGVDMTRTSDELKKKARTPLHPFLQMAGSQHGRLELMTALPTLPDLVSAPQPFIEQMIFSLDFPEQKATHP